MAKKSLVEFDYLTDKDFRIDENGAEIVSDKSSVVEAYLPTLGERIRRYQSSPRMQDKLLLNPDLWDEGDHGILDDVNNGKTSVHEVRYQNGLKKAAKVKRKRDEDAKKIASEKHSKKLQKRQQEIRDAIAAGSIPTPPPPPNKAGN